MELRMQLAEYAEKYREMGGHDLADLLETAGDELEIAIGLIDQHVSKEALNFLERHSSPIPEGEAAVLNQALTGSNGAEIYRNYYAAGKNHHSIKHIESLISKGLLVRGGCIGDSFIHHVTEKGIALASKSLHKPEPWQG